MIVRTLDEARNTSRRVVDPAGNWESVRLLLKDDRMGFSFHITTIFKGADFRMHYRHHLESVYCISGVGEVETLADAVRHRIVPGTVYILDRDDEQVLRATEDMVVACVFNPPLTGSEVHNAEGAYELEPEPASLIR